MNLTPFEWLVIGIVFSVGIGIVGYFLKRTMNRTDRHDDKINDFPQKYVTKAELKEFKGEIRGETAKLTGAVEEIRANYLPKADYLQHQARNDQQLTRILDMLMEMKGGGGNARP